MQLVLFSEIKLAGVVSKAVITLLCRMGLWCGYGCRELKKIVLKELQLETGDIAARVLDFQFYIHGFSGVQLSVLAVI